MKKKLRIVFMGSPQFAVASLEAILEAGIEVVGVITAVDKKAGRGKKMNESAVKKFAIERNLKVLQPKNLKSQKFLAELDGLQADLFVVVAFRMLPEVVFSMPDYGTFNLHASLLPEYRGAAPINWAIINGEKTTGLTTFFIEKEIDTGEILLQKRIDILEQDNAGSLHDKLMSAGSDLVVQTIVGIADDSLSPRKQEDFNIDLPLAPKIFREHCEIDFSSSAKTVHDFIRGLSPYPGAWTTINGQNCKIFAADYHEMAHDMEEGDIRSDGKTFISMACSDGQISVIELQLAGKKRMKVSEFLRGNGDLIPINSIKP